MEEPRLRLVGMNGSPYSRKLRAVLRYRRIPHRWILHGSPESESLPEPRVALLPRLVGLDGDDVALVDSTPLIRRLEAHVSGRSVIPEDPALAFVDALLEDYADEWVTRAMFHYRWSFAPDVARAASILPRVARPELPEARARQLGDAFARRQVGRLGVVGSNEVTAPVIEDSYRRLLALLDARLAESRFVLGARPTACDFALYGQLTQLVGFDPTPMALAAARAPRVVAWVEAVDDLSGLEPGGAALCAVDALPDSVRALLCEVGRVHVPFLLANAEALEAKAERVECTLDGRPWVQRPFPYQGRCLVALREGHEALAPEARARVDRALAGTGCERLFQAS